MERLIPAIGKSFVKTRMPVAGKRYASGSYPNLEFPRREPAGIGANDQRAVRRRFAETEIAVKFIFSLPPIFQFVPGHATAFLKNLVGAFSDGSLCAAGF